MYTYLDVCRWIGRYAATQEALHKLAYQIPAGARQAARLVFHLSVSQSKEEEEEEEETKTKLETVQFLLIGNRLQVRVHYHQSEESEQVIYRYEGH